jgi:hypothetical protein
MLYQVTIEDIEKSKQWGLTVTYTTIAVHGALLGLFSAYDSSRWVGLIKAFFIWLLISLTILGVHHIRQAQRSLSGFRERIKRIRELFGEPFHNVFGNPTPKEEWPLEFFVWTSVIVIPLLILLSPNS